MQSIREEVLGYVDEAIAKGISERRTCNYLELNRKTIQNWRQYKGTPDKRKEYEPINYITCFSIPVSNSIGTVKCIEVVYYA